MLAQTRHATGRSVAVTTFILLFAMVGAIVVGLLTMHILATAMGEHGEPATASLVIEGPVDHQHPGGAVDCDATCDPGHSTTAMACVLGLLVTVILFGNTRRTLFSPLSPHAASPFRRAVARPPMNANAPPDLNTLSISRT